MAEEEKEKEQSKLLSTMMVVFAMLVLVFIGVLLFT